MKHFLVLILLFIGVSGFAQNTVISLDITTRDDDTGKKLSGATVIVKSGGSVFVTKTSASNGKVPIIDLPLGQNYEVYVQKEGYVTKMVTIDGHFDYPEDLPPLLPFAMESSLFAKVDGVDFAWLERTPMVKFELDQYGNQAWDQAALKEMLKRIEKLKEELAAKKGEEAKKKADFDAFVAAGDKSNTAEDYVKAIENYDKALGLFDDATVKKKRDDAQKALDAQNKGAELEKQYLAKMNAAKDQFVAKNYEEALKLYKEAGTLKTAEQAPKDKIIEIEKILKDQKDQQAKFDQFVKDGDAAVGTKAYDNAIKSYESALAIKEDAGVKAKLEDAKKKKAEQESADQAAKDLDAKYNALIADADKAFNAKTYEEAKAKYVEALKLKPGESIPAARISEIDEILKKLKADEDATKKLEADYKKFIDEGDVAMTSKNWDGAIAKYEEALKLKPTETYPQNQIKLAKSNKEKDVSAKELTDKYNKTMADAKVLKDAKKYEEAIAKYQEAQKLLPDEKEPTEKIAEITKLMADQANAKEKEEKYTAFMKDGNDLQTKSELEAALGKYESALGIKPGDAEATKKIAEVKKLIADKKAQDEQGAKFDAFVAAGDKDLGNKTYASAKTNYEKALAIKDDAAVREKIKQIDEILANTAKEAENQAKYDAAIKSADAAFTSGKYEDAIAKYEEALKFKEMPYPNEQIAKARQKIAEMANAQEKEKLFNDYVAKGNDLASKNDFMGAIKNYEEAIKIKPDPALSQKIVDLKQKQKELDSNLAVDEQYKKKIAEADVAFKAKNWDGAIALYKDALDIKGTEQYPKDQLLEIERLMKAESENEVEAQYQKIITKADELKKAEDYDEAISYYERAKTIKKADPYPQQQIDAINEIKAQKQKELANKEEFEKQYKELIASGDKALAAKDYEGALKKYEEAIKMKPTETYPANKIAEIKAILDKLNEQAGLDTKYKAAIDKADKLFNADDFTSAKSAYQDALAIKGSEQYPKDQIAKCDAKLKDQSANEAEIAYQKILTAAKKKFDEKDYQGAIEEYKKALGIRPADTFPQQQIDMINKLLADQGADAAKDAKYKIAIEKADKLFKSSEFIAAKSAYQDALDIKGTEQYPKDQIALCEKNMQSNSLDEEEEQYQKILAIAQKKFDEKDYTKALEYYERAKGIRTTDPLPQQRIDEINQLLKDQQSEKDKRDRFNKLIQQADTHFERQEWKEALEVYMDALDIFQEQYPKDQVEKCRNFIKANGDTAEKEYQKLISKADEYFDAQNYEKAKDLYTRATRLKPSDQYPKDRLKEINKILNPPAVLTGVDNQLKDYGPPVNEKPIDMESMLYEAKEQVNEFEIQRIYQQREDSEQKLSDLSEINEDNAHDTKDAADLLVEDIEENKEFADEARKNARDEVDQLQEDYAVVSSEREVKQENDIQYQNKTVEAIHVELTENKMDNDVPREEYLLDVEKIKIENEKRIESDVTIQENVIQNDMGDIEFMVDNHVTGDPNNDVARKNTEVEVEDLNVILLNSNNENAWDQEDGVMGAKDETEMMVDDILANTLDDDIVRTDNLVVVEKMVVSFEEREGQNTNDQVDNNMDAKVYTEEIITDILDNNLESDKPRQDTELIVENVQVSTEETLSQNQSDQYDNSMDAKNYTEDLVTEIDQNNFENDKPRIETLVIVENKQIEFAEREQNSMDNQIDNVMSTDSKIENIELKIDEHNAEMNSDREGYEKEVVKITENITDKDSEMSTANENNGFDVKDHTEVMADEVDEINRKTDDNANLQADKNLDAIEKNIEIIEDKQEHNDNALVESEAKIESMKEIDVNQVTPELANELGKKYAEGVTEESFAINDMNGLLKAYVIRRVVVINGAGKVYEMTQTRYGQTTYTRNGQPISEYQWSDESSGLGIQRN